MLLKCQVSILNHGLVRIMKLVSLTERKFLCLVKVIIASTNEEKAEDVANHVQRD